jgi:hypothetical protein
MRSRGGKDDNARVADVGTAMLARRSSSPSHTQRVLLIAGEALLSLVLQPGRNTYNALIPAILHW